VGALIRKEQPLVFTEIGVHTDMEITLEWDGSGAVPMICFGDDGRTRMIFADADSLDRLSAVAAQGARQFRELLARKVLACLRGADREACPS
jgi:hypothetical protein